MLFWAQSLSSATSVTIGGNLIITGGTFYLGSNNNSATNVLLNGNFQKTGGTIINNGSGVGTIRFDGGVQTYVNNSPITSAVSFSVQSGSTLNLGTAFLTGTGAFTLFSGGTLNVGSTDAGGAIQLGTAGGNIRMSGTRTYQAGSTIVYNGAIAQFMGAGHPAAPNTTLSNPSNIVTMVSNVTINGALNLSSHNLFIENNTLTVGGAFSRTTGAFGARTTSSMVINGSGDFADLVFSFSEFANNPINNLTINRTGGTVFLGNSLIVGGTFTQTNGNFSLGAFSSYTLTLRGNFAQTGGSLVVFGLSGLVIEGAGTLPANVAITGPNLGILTMDRPGSTFATTSPVTIVNLNLFNGVVNNATFNLTMASDGLLTRRSGGSITQVLGVSTSYDVLYFVTTDIVTGNELPFTSPVTTRLGNLTKVGPATVFLNHDIVVNGTFTIIEGIFDVTINNDVTINRNLTVDGTFETQQGLVTFAGGAPQTISGTVPITFFDVAISQTASSTLDITTNVDVENSLTVTSASTINAGNQLLRLVSNATGTAYVAPLNATASIVGTVIAERFLPNNAAARVWRYISAPVTGTSVADWKTEMTITGTFSDPATGPGVVSNSPSMYVYDETFVAGGPNLEDRYRRYPASGLAANAPIINGRGYSVFGRTEGEIMFDSRGTLAQGDRPVSVTSSGGANGGWNLIGNPYPAPIDWDNVAIPGGVNNAVYIYDNADNADNGGVGFVSYVNGVSSPDSFEGELAQGQAFFVRATGNATITFQENDKVSSSQSQFFREQDIPDLLRITLKGNNHSDETVLRLHEEATDLFDGKYDAYKFPNPALSLATLTKDNEKLVINSVSSLECSMKVPLVIESATKGSYRLNFIGIETFNNGSPLFLFDKLKNEKTDLTRINEYSFTLSEADLDGLKNRFELLIGKPVMDSLSIRQEGETLISSYEQGNQWYLDGVMIENGTSQEITPMVSGIYSVVVNQKGCTVSAAREMTITELEENGLSNMIKIYPNPTSDKITVEVNSNNGAGTVVKLMSPLGLELRSLDLDGVDKRSGEFDLRIYPQGVYLIRIHDGQSFYTKKVSKIE